MNDEQISQKLDWWFSVCSVENKSRKPKMYTHSTWVIIWHIIPLIPWFRNKNLSLGDEASTQFLHYWWFTRRFHHPHKFSLSYSSTALPIITWLVVIFGDDNTFVSDSISFTCSNTSTTSITSNSLLTAGATFCKTYDGSNKKSTLYFIKLRSWLRKIEIRL